LVGGEGFAVDASLIKAEANRERSVPGDPGLPPEASSRAIDEYLAVLDDAAFGGATPVTPKFISPVDPAARWTAANKGPAFFAYATNYLIDLKHAVIVDVEASTAVRPAELTAARTMIERVQDKHDLHPDRLAADTAYGSAEMLEWLVNDRGIAPHIPIIDKSGRTDGTYSRADFSYDRAADLYRCPGDKELKQYRRAFRADHPDTPPDDTYRYRASKIDCDACALKPKCCPNGPARKVTRSIHEDARDVTRDIARTDAYVTSRRERKKVEMLFAHLKRILRLDRLRLRGPCGARDEFLLAATAQNLRKMARLIPIQTSPVPV
ncbi:MAG: transposase, partial [Brevundimonas mediterranea]